MSTSQEERRRIAGEYLLRARDDFDRAERVRAAYINAARAHGLTETDISNLLGIRVDQLETIAGPGGA